MQRCRIKTPTRGIVLGCLLAMAALGGACAVRETTSIVDRTGDPSESARPLGRAAAHLEMQEKDVPTNDTNASGRVDFDQSYATPTMVDIVMSGWIIRTNKYNGQKDYVGPGGYSNCNSGATVLRWNGGAWVSPNCTNGASPVSGWAVMNGAVYAERSAMGTTCGQGAPPCFTYTNNIHVTLTPRVGTLSLSCSPAEITGTSNVYCTLTSSLPSFTTNIVWNWTDARPASETPSCQFGCWFMGRSWTGKVTVTATVNGTAKTATASVRRRCITGDSVIDASGDRRAHLSGVWAAGGDRDTSGNVIAVGDRREAGQSGRPGGSWGPLHRADSATGCSLIATADRGQTDFLHSHPWVDGDSLPNSCWGDPTPGFQRFGRGISRLDALFAARANAYASPFRVIAIEPDSIFYINGGSVGGYDSTLVNGRYEFRLRDTTAFLAQVQRHGRSGAFACTLP